MNKQSGRTKRTPMVILGILCSEPMSGYDIKTTLERTIGHFWQESFGQIYPALAQMLKQGWVKRSRRATGGRRRDVYSITKKGRQVLEAWLSDPPASRNLRDELLVKVFFGAFAPADSIRLHLANARLDALAGVKYLEYLVAELNREWADAPELKWSLLTIDLGRRVALARAQWAEEALQNLEESC